MFTDSLQESTIIRGQYLKFRVYKMVNIGRTGRRQSHKRYSGGKRRMTLIFG